jgi:hypothetical protein
MIAVWLKIDEDRIAQTLRDARENLDNARGRTGSEFPSVYRNDPSVLRAMENV